jgi:molecular chaperone DnaK
MPAPRGVPKIKVTFDIDANGILSVTAKDEATGRDQKITISASSGLSKEEVERMVQDAAAHEEEDKKRRDEIESRNKADQLCYATEKALAEAKDKLPADKVADIESRVKSLREAIERQDADAIRTGAESLEKTMHELAASAYAAAGGAREGAPGGQAGGDKKKKGPSDVIDAEFEDEQPN